MLRRTFFAALAGLAAVMRATTAEARGTKKTYRVVQHGTMAVREEGGNHPLWRIEKSDNPREAVRLSFFGGALVSTDRDSLEDLTHLLNKAQGERTKQA